jgi:hypothetical protein
LCESGKIAASRQWEKLPFQAKWEIITKRQMKKNCELIVVHRYMI